VRLGGVVANRSRETDQIDRFNDEVGLQTMAVLPDSDAIRRSRLNKCTLFEMEETEEVTFIQERYTELAETMIAGTEGLAPDPLADDHLFNLLGYD